MVCHLTVPSLADVEHAVVRKAHRGHLALQGEYLVLRSKEKNKGHTLWLTSPVSEPRQVHSNTSQKAYFKLSIDALE